MYGSGSCLSATSNDKTSSKLNQETLRLAGMHGDRSL